MNHAGYHINIRETGPGIAQATLVRPGMESLYADIKLVWPNGRDWSCRESLWGTEFIGNSRTEALRPWLKALNLDLDRIKTTTIRSY